MKHTINFFTFLVLFIASVMFLTMPVNAVVYENMFDDPVGLGTYDIDTILVSEGTSPSTIRYFYTDGAGSASTIITNITDYCEDACVGVDGYIYFVLTDGRVYQFIGGYGIYNFVDDYNTSFLLLGDIDGYTCDRGIVADNNNNIYVTGGAPAGNTYGRIYKFAYPSLTLSLFVQVDFPALHFAYFDCIGIHPDGIIAGTQDFTTQSYGELLYIIYENLSYTPLVVVSDDGGVLSTISGVYATDNKDIYYTTSYGNLLKRLDYSDGYSISTIASVSNVEDILIDNNGIIYVCRASADTIETYSTYDLGSGYSYYYQEGVTGEKQLDYDVSALNSVYAAYNNDSTIELLYSIDIDLVQGITTQDFYDSEGDHQYYWIVDVLDDDGIKQKSSIINTFDKDYNIVSGWHIISVGNLQYTANPWQAGNWSAVLYEYDMSTGLRAQLDSCEFEIYEQVSDTTIIDETPGVDPTLDPINRIDALLESNAFVGLLIILACMGAFGKVGGVVGLVLGTVAGVSLASLLGYIPGWIMFVMIMALCVVFTSKLIGVFGGGNE